MTILSLARRLSGQWRRAGPSSGTGGFTLVELLTVTVVLGTLARAAGPGVHQVVLDARAAEVVGHMEVVQVAALNHQADRLLWPSDAYPGQTPAGLELFLPEGFSLDQGEYLLDWDNLPLPDGLPGDPSARRLLAVTLVTPDRELAQAVETLLGGAHYVVGDRYTFVFERE